GACTIPATGEVAPERILVAVRAIAPVAGMPPKKGTKRFARPWANSSTSGLWRSPLMLSATTAERRLSIAANMATVQADGNSGRMRSARNCGIEIAGKPVGIPWNLLPIVSIGIAKNAQASVVINNPTMEPGTLLLIQGQSSTIPNVTTAINSAVPETELAL